MHKPLHHRVITSLLLVFALIVLPARVQAQGETNLPPLDEFIAEVTNGEAADLRGLYVSGVLADVIVPQPEGDVTYVSSQSDTLTQFEMASHFGTLGLLAHNYLAGNDFFRLEEGQLLYLIYGNGRVETYIIREFMRYRALSPQSATSDFVDLENGETLSASQLFMKVFQREGDVVLQTCVYADGDASWGRLFIIAVPYDQLAPISMLKHLEFR